MASELHGSHIIQSARRRGWADEKDDTGRDIKKFVSVGTNLDFWGFGGGESLMFGSTLEPRVRNMGTLQAMRVYM